VAEKNRFAGDFVTRKKSCPPARRFLRLMSLLIAVVGISACAAQLPPAPETIPRIMDAEDLAFEQAESLWRQGELYPALGRYSSYLGHFPEGRHAAAAMFRIAGIYHHHGDLDPAQAYYLRLIDMFPQTPTADEARLAVFNLLVGNNRATEAMSLAPRLLDGEPGLEVRWILWRKLVDLHHGIGDDAHVALYAYFLHIQGPLSEQEKWGVLLRNTIALLDGSDIEMLWERMDDPAVRGDLMFHYGVMQMLQDNDDVALEVLTAFSRAYPEHPDALDAADYIETLTQRLTFEPFTIGCLLPLSGSHAAFGQRALQAVEMALGMVQSGDAPLPIKLIVQDSASNDEDAVRAVRSLVKAGAGAIIGPIQTAPAAAVEAQRLRIPIVTFTQRPDITTIGDYVFRHFITPQNQARTLVAHFINNLQLRDFAVFYPEEAYGRTFLMHFWDEVVRQGGRLVGAAAYDPQQTDFAESLKSLVGLQYPVPADLQRPSLVQVDEPPYFPNSASGGQGLATLLPDPISRLSGLYHSDPDQDRERGPDAGRRSRETGAEPIIDFDVLFIPDAPHVAGLILPQLVFHDVHNIYLAGTNLWHSQQLIDMARDYAQNAVMVDGFFKESQSPAVRGFVDMYRDFYDIEPGLMEAFAFDTANMLFALLSNPGIRLRSHLRHALNEIEYTGGVTGATTFNADGDALKTLCTLRIQGDRFVEIE
jgi:branched-chain amino acid transport system substrate-binding protein